MSIVKTYRNLYPQIYGFANLRAAYRAARRAKRGWPAIEQTPLNQQ